jgi:hypothetical protein
MVMAILSRTFPLPGSVTVSAALLRVIKPDLGDVDWLLAHNKWQLNTVGCIGLPSSLLCVWFIGVAPCAGRQSVLGRLNTIRRMNLPFCSCAIGLLACPYAGRQSLSLLLQRK